MEDSTSPQTPSTRQFDLNTSQALPIPGVQGVRAAMIQLPAAMAERLGEAEVARRFAGRPIVLEQPLTVVSLHFEAGGHIHEHDADHDILFMVVAGSGFSRIGGPDGRTHALEAGQALLWPKDVLHVAWTEEASMQAIVIEYPAN